VEIREASTDEEILACYPVIAQLRTHVEQHEFLDRVQDQQKAGYRLLYIAEGNRVVAVAGYRIANSLAWGRYLYVDDLVTAGMERSSGYGQALMDRLFAVARERKCDSFHVDSGVQRHAAHRFYLRNRLAITSHHFSMTLDD
jgi:hypothetical protein